MVETNAKQTFGRELGNLFFLITFQEQQKS
jgi:hypothetical protein